MAYDESLAKRIDELIKDKAHLTEAKGSTRKEMFGGVGYLLNGNMCVGVHKDRLIVRHGPKAAVDIKSDKNVGPFDITGRQMKGWALVNSAGVKSNGLSKWFDISLNFVKSLPAKK